MARRIALPQFVVRSSLRNRLLLTFLILVVVAGLGTLLAIKTALENDLLSALKTRLTNQGRAVAGWIATARHLDQLTPRLAEITGARITIIGGDGLIEGDSAEHSTVNRPIGDAWEVAEAR